MGEGSGLLAEHVGALEHALAARGDRDGVEGGDVLPGEDQGDRSVLAGDRVREGGGRFFGVAGADHVEVRDAAQRAHGLDRLVGRAVFADADGVVREDVERLELGEGRHADRGAEVVGERQERRAGALEDAVVGDAVEDGAHDVLTDAEVEVASGRGRDVEVADVLDVVLGRAVEVGRSGEHEGRGLGDGVDARLAGDAGRERVLAELRDGGEEGLDVAVVALLGLGEERGLLGVGLGPGGEGLPPFGVRGGLPGLAGGEEGAGLGRDEELLFREAEGLARGVDELHAGFAVALGGALDFGDALADDGLADDQLGLAVLAGAGLFERFGDRGELVALLDGEHFPVGGFVALGGVLVLRLRGQGVEGDVVGVVEHDEVIEAEAAGERGGLLRDAFLEAAVAGETDHQVVEDLVLRGVEVGGGHLGGDGHADDVAGALTEGAGGGFDADGLAELGVTRGLGVELAEILHFLEREVEAGEVQPAVDEHRTVPGREDEAVAVDPGWRGGVVPEEVAVEDGADLGGAEGQAQVAGMAGGHGIHGEAAGFGGGTGKVGGTMERHKANP